MTSDLDVGEVDRDPPDFLESDLTTTLADIRLFITFPLNLNLLIHKEFIECFEGHSWIESGCNCCYKTFVLVTESPQGNKDDFRFFQRLSGCSKRVLENRHLSYEFLHRGATLQDLFEAGDGGEVASFELQRHTIFADMITLLPKYEKMRPVVEWTTKCQ